MENLLVRSWGEVEQGDQVPLLLSENLDAQVATALQAGPVCGIDFLHLRNRNICGTYLRQPRQVLVRLKVQKRKVRAAAWVK